MKPCPQCGTQLGEGAKACASCGWKAGMSKVLLVFLIVFGFFLLVCGGFAVFVGIQAKKGLDLFRAEGTPMFLSTYHVAVVEYAQSEGRLPATIQEAMQASGQKVQMPEGSDAPDAQGAVDSWFQQVRYTANEDGTFEIRSAGPDRRMDTADDIVETGSKDEDLKALRKEARRRSEAFSQKMGEAFGAKIRTHDAPAEESGDDGGPPDRAPAGPPEEAPESGDGEGDGGD